MAEHKRDDRSCPCLLKLQVEISVTIRNYLVFTGNFPYENAGSVPAWRLVGIQQMFMKLMLNERILEKQFEATLLKDIEISCRRVWTPS